MAFDPQKAKKAGAEGEDWPEIVIHYHGMRFSELTGCHGKFPIYKIPHL